MKRMMTRLTLVLLLFAQTQAATPPADGFKFKVEEEILGLVRQLAEAQKNYDAAKLDEILAPDYIEISPAGEVDSRAKVLGFYA
ncbi:MAG TPA: nuclear transport factor 2 family protein, partial [Pyrinomonadaceae bacterium]